MFEKPAFAEGTLAMARAVAAATKAGATSIVGGGDSVSAVEQSGVAQQISHISTGGGASWNSSQAKSSRASRRSPTCQTGRLNENEKEF